MPLGSNRLELGQFSPSPRTGEGRVGACPPEVRREPRSSTLRGLLSETTTPRGPTSSGTPVAPRREEPAAAVTGRRSVGAQAWAPTLLLPNNEAPGRGGWGSFSR